MQFQPCQGCGDLFQTIHLYDGYCAFCKEKNMNDLGTCIECGNPATCLCCECEVPLCDECEQDGLCPVCRTNQPEVDEAAIRQEYIIALREGGYNECFPEHPV